MQIGVAEDKRSKPLAAFLLLYCTTFTVVYLYVVNPVFHEVSHSISPATLLICGSLLYN